MEDYLKGYLDVIPESERKKVSDVIKQNQELIVAGDWSEQEFEKAIDQLVSSHQKLTTYLPQQDVLDSKKHNQFFGNMQADLNLLFAESDLIESGLNSYSRLYEGILSDLQREVTTLRKHIESLRLTSESEGGVVAKQFDFSTDKDMEVYAEGKSYLFTDRDNTVIPRAVIERDQETSRMILQKTMENDRMRDSKGNVTATIEVIDRRGVPVRHAGEKLYGIEKALDSSTNTYWGEVILVDQPLNVKMIT